MKNKFWKKYGYGFGAAICITAFTGFALLDAFVIPRPMQVVDETTLVSQKTLNYMTETEDGGVSASTSSNSGTDIDAYDDTNSGANSHANMEEEGENPAREKAQKDLEPLITEDSYQDDHISIKISTYREENTDIFVADIMLETPEYLKTALAKDIYGRNVTQATSEIAENHNALFAVNGDFYGARNEGYVIRSGVLYRSASAGNEDLVIYGDGSFGIISEDEVSAEALLEQGAAQVLSFGPALLQNREICVGKKDEVGRSMASNPRTAVGMIEEKHYVFVVSDGRTRQSAGLSLYELADFMKGLGVVTAYNLDGGGSSTMYFMGNVINHPTTGGRTMSERSVSDIVYVGY